MDVWTFLIVLLLTSAPALATQHLVSPGQPWSELAPRLRPGDEIILMPGRHQPAAFDDLTGTRERPITIRSVHPDHPAVIDARREGIRLRRPQHVVIRDLTITGATIAGISITDEPEPPPPPGFPDERPDRGVDRDKPWPAHVTIRNVIVEETGPRGRRHGIRLAGVEHVRVERSRIDGWGGSAIKIIAAANVVIEHCTMRGRPDHGQLSGIQIRAGSENVRITRCTISDAGESAIVLGGSSRPEDFRPALTENPSAEQVYEARRITIERCIIERGESAFAFVGADHCTVRNNTVINPTRWAYFIASPSSEPTPQHQAVHRSTFGANLIVWQPGSIASLGFVQPRVKAQGLEFQQNLWWSEEDNEVRAKLGPPVGNVTSDQVMDIDPDLGEDRKPRNPRARMFGPDGP